MSQDIYVLVEHSQGQVAEISHTLLAAGNQQKLINSSKLVAVLLGYQAQSLAQGLAADQVLYIDHPDLKEFNPDAYIKVLAEVIKAKQPHLFLLGHTSMGSDIAGILSITLDLPLTSSCRIFTTDGNAVCQICGGKIMVEVKTPASSCLVTMIPGGYNPEINPANKPPIETFNPPPLDDVRTKVIQVIQPDSSDVDISKEPILIAVGRGIQTQDNLELAEKLAGALKGVVCASRPVVDQGWVPTTRLVGKSGKYVKPKVYFALGISGAPEHAEAIGNSETIIAVNTDPKAPIFNLATYGTETDLFDLIDPLVEKIEKAKSG